MMLSGGSTTNKYRQCGHPNTSISSAPLSLFLKQHVLKRLKCQSTVEKGHQIGDLDTPKSMSNVYCHICRKRKASCLLFACGISQHSYCATHMTDRLGTSISEVCNSNNTEYHGGFCPVCTLHCTCAKCNRRLQEFVCYVQSFYLASPAPSLESSKTAYDAFVMKLLPTLDLLSIAKGTKPMPGLSQTLESTTEDIIAAPAATTTQNNENQGQEEESARNVAFENPQISNEEPKMKKQKTPATSKSLEQEFYNACKKVSADDVRSWDSLREMLNEFQNNLPHLQLAACYQGNEHLDHGRTPLHILLEKNPPLDVVSAIAIFAALGKKNKTGQLPIHTACQNKASLEVLELLIQFYPEGLTVQDAHGFLPIHDLCHYGASLEAIDMFIKACPRSLQVQDLQQCLPIHCACRCSLNLEVLNLLLVAYPESLEKKSSLGRPSSILNKYDRNILKLQDEEGRIPLHYAYILGLSTHLIKLVTDAFPKGVEVTDIHSKTPLCYASGTAIGAFQLDASKPSLARVFHELMEDEQQNITTDQDREVLTDDQRPLRNDDEQLDPNVTQTKVASEILNNPDESIGTMATDHLMESNEPFLPHVMQSEPTSEAVAKGVYNKKVRSALMELQEKIDTSVAESAHMKVEMKKMKMQIIQNKSSISDLKTELLNIKAVLNEMKSDQEEFKDMLSSFLRI